MIQTFTFGEWLPDLPDLGNPGVTRAENVMPHLGGYIPLNALFTTSTALTAYCRGAIALSDADGNSELYAGDATKLYRYASDTWADKSGAAYTNASTDYWEFIAWGQAVIATNYADAIQTKAYGAGTNFAALGGSPPKAKHIAVVRGFVVLGDVNDGTHYSSRVQWSGQNLETSWGSNPATQADYQDLVGDGGKIQAVTSGDVGVIVQERSLWEMRYEGPPTIFKFDETAVGVGTPAARSVVRFGNSIFFLGQDGFYRYDVGTGLTPIGDKKVDLWFLNRVNTDLYYRMVGALNVQTSKIMWCYSVGASDPDEIIIYDLHDGTWSFATVTTEIIFANRTTGTTLEQLNTPSGSDIDLAGLASLDSSQWKAGALAIGGFSTAHKSGNFNGAAMTAIMETAEFGDPEARMQTIRSARPLVQSSGESTITVYVGYRDSLNQAITYTSGSVVNSAGDHDLRLSARYMRMKVEIAGGFQRAIGTMVTTEKQGAR